jgi:hypothetical protein
LSLTRNVQLLCLMCRYPELAIPTSAYCSNTLPTIGLLAVKPIGAKCYMHA